MKIKRASACTDTCEVAKLQAFYGLHANLCSDVPYACLVRVMYGNCTRVNGVLRVNMHERYCSTATHEISLSQTPDISNLTEIKIKGA